MGVREFAAAGGAPPELCNGLMIPIVMFDQIYNFSRDVLIEAIPRPERISAEAFAPAARELFDRIMQMTDNAGATDEHRALNYLAVRYPNIYARAAEAYGGVHRGGIARQIRARIPRTVERMAASTSISAGCMR